MIRSMFFFAATVFLSPLAIVVVNGAKNHCSSMENRGPVDCEVLTMPKGLCSACTIAGQYLTEGDMKGHFTDCTHAYDLESDQRCVPLLQKYVELNQCDTARKEALEQYMQGDDAEMRAFGRITLDYFLYAFCELACDCLPRDGAEYSKPVVDVHRANCPAHAQIDICNGPFKELRLIRLEGTEGDDDLTMLPKACDGLNDWKMSPLSKDPLVNPHTTLGPDTEYFLSRAMEALELDTSAALYNDCLAFEDAQSRIHLAEDTVPPPSQFCFRELCLFNLFRRFRNMFDQFPWLK
jgi:hypothetical protein